MTDEAGKASWRKLIPVAAALIVGTVGGALFHALHTPVPWMLGAMVATSIAALSGITISIPRGLRNAFVPVLGVMFGSVVDVHNLPGGAQLFALALLVISYLIVTIGLGWLFFRRAGFDGATSFFASVPGNFSEVVIIAENLGADIRSVALVHSARIAIAIPVISFGLQYLLHVDATGVAEARVGIAGMTDLAVLAGCAIAGYALAALIRMPAPQMFGPLILSTIAHAQGFVDGAPPVWAVAGAQVLLGTFTGARFSGVSLGSIIRIFALSAVWAVLLLFIILGFAAATAHQILGLPVSAVFLAFSPGGFAEISMVAMAAGLGLGFISATQFLRMTFAILVIPLSINAWQRWQERRRARGAD